MARTPFADVSNVEDVVDPTVNDDITKGLDVGSRWTNTAGGRVWFCTDNTTGSAVWKDVTSTGGSGAGISFKMTLGGCLTVPALPFVDAGIEIANAAGTLTTFVARRGNPETSGTTTIQLEVNGGAIGGATLSWTIADAAFALKTVAISQAVSINDRVSFRLTAAGTNAEDIYAVVA